MSGDVDKYLHFADDLRLQNMCVQDFCLLSHFTFHHQSLKDRRLPLLDFSKSKSSPKCDNQQKNKIPNWIPNTLQTNPSRLHHDLIVSISNIYHIKCGNISVSIKKVSYFYIYLINEFDWFWPIFSYTRTSLRHRQWSVSRLYFWPSVALKLASLVFKCMIVIFRQICVPYDLMESEHSLSQYDTVCSAV